MAVAYVASQENTFGIVSSPQSFSVTVGTRTDGAVVLSLSGNASNTIASMSATYDGNAMTASTLKQRSVSGTYIWAKQFIYPVGSGSGTAKTIEITFSVSSSGTMFSIFACTSWWDNVLQSSPLDQDQQGEGSTDPTVDITPTEDGEALTAVYHSEANSNPSPAGETLMQEWDQGLRVNGASYYEQSSAALVTMNFTGPDDENVISAISFKTVAASGDYSVSETDGVTLGESVTVTLPDALAASKSEGVTLGESVTADLQIDISATDGAEIGEAVTVTMDDLAVSVTDGVTTGEAAAAVLPDALALSVTDDIQPDEANTQALDDLEVDQTEGLTVDEAAAAVLPDALALDVTDDIGPGESSNVVFEGGAPADLSVNVTDGIAEIGETFSAVMSDLGVTVSDNLTPGEANTSAMSDLGVTVTDGIAGIGETFTPAMGDLAVIASDNITPADTATTSMPDAMQVSISEGLTLGESSTVSVAATVTPLVSLTVQARDASFTAQARDSSMTVLARSGVWLPTVIEFVSGANWDDVNGGAILPENSADAGTSLTAAARDTSMTIQARATALTVQSR